MSAEAIGRIAWSLNVDDEGYREYTLRTLVETSTPEDGPYVAMRASGLPARGSYWNFGNDIDFQATYRPTITAKPVYDVERCVYWIVENKFSTKPTSKNSDGGSGGGGGGGASTMKISGSFTRYQKKVKKDRHGNLIKSSSHELIDGIEKELDRPTVSIEQTSIAIGPNSFQDMVSMVTCVNDAPLWGLLARQIMLTNVEWTNNFSGDPIYRYSRTLHFEARWLANDDGFDLEDILDTGWKVLRGKWVGDVWTPDGDVDPTNPNDFIVFKDKFQTPFPIRTALNAGNPLTDMTDPKFIPKVELANEANFFLLGIPMTL